MNDDYLARVLRAKVYDVAIDSPLDDTPRLSARIGNTAGLGATVDWYRANEAWWRATKSGEWDDYYRRQYGARLAGSHDLFAAKVI